VKSLINWITDHDNKTLFVVLYIGLSIVLSIAISLFWLLFVVLIHFAFELVTQSRAQSGAKNIFYESLWETKLDFALVVFALLLAVYLDFIFGVAGLGAAARGGAVAASRTGAGAANTGAKVAQVSTRFVAMQRAIRGIMLSLDDVANASKSFFQRKKPKSEKINEPEKNSAGNNYVASGSSWTAKWSVIDYIGVAVFAVSALLILLAPVLIGMNWSEILTITTEEFHPFPR
jgi:hypothetical protein